MQLTEEELKYISPANGFSLLHLAITYRNSDLVALFVSYELNSDLSATGGITPRKLIEKIGGLVPGMIDAFNHPAKFLQKSGFMGDSEPIVDSTEHLHFIDVDDCDQGDNSVVPMGFAIDL